MRLQIFTICHLIRFCWPDQDRPWRQCQTAGSLNDEQHQQLQRAKCSPTQDHLSAFQPAQCSWLLIAQVKINLQDTGDLRNERRCMWPSIFFQQHIIAVSAVQQKMIWMTFYRQLSLLWGPDKRLCFTTDSSALNLSNLPGCRRRAWIGMPVIDGEPHWAPFMISCKRRSVSLWLMHWD